MPKHLAGALVLALLAGFVAAPLAAQEEPMGGGTPGVLVSEQICDTRFIDDLNELVENYWRTVLDQAVADGRLTGWGVLNHAWGDEWNWIIYYTGDVATLIGTASELLGEMMEAAPGDPMEQFGEWCGAHKDNLYVQPFVQSVQPPAPGGD